MTTTASHDSLDPTAGQQTRRPDELEHWLTDLRVNLSEDPPDWLTPADDTNDPPTEFSPLPLPTKDHTGQHSDTMVGATNPSSLKGDPPGLAAGRHRAAD